MALKMGITNRTCILLCLLVVVATCAERACNSGAPCIRFEECKGLYTAVTRSPPVPVKDLIIKLHCGFNENNSWMICCPPGLLTDPMHEFRSRSAMVNKSYIR